VEGSCRSERHSKVVSGSEVASGEVYTSRRVISKQLNPEGARHGKGATEGRIDQGKTRVQFCSMGVHQSQPVEGGGANASTLFHLICALKKVG